MSCARKSVPANSKSNIAVTRPDAGSASVLDAAGSPPVVRGVPRRNILQCPADLPARPAETLRHRRVGEVRWHPWQPAAHRRRALVGLHHCPAVERGNALRDSERQPSASPPFQETVLGGHLGCGRY